MSQPVKQKQLRLSQVHAHTDLNSSCDLSETPSLSFFKFGLFLLLETIISVLETTLVASLDSSTDTEYPHVNVPAASSNPPEAAPDSSNSPGAADTTADSEEDYKGHRARSQAEEEVVSDKTEEQEKTQDEEDKETEAPAAETGTLTRTPLLKSQNKLRTFRCVK